MKRNSENLFQPESHPQAPTSGLQRNRFYFFIESSTGLGWCWGGFVQAGAWMDCMAGNLQVISPLLFSPCSLLKLKDRSRH